MKHSEYLKKAQSLLMSHDEKYVCHAIKEVLVNDLSLRSQQMNFLRDWVQKDLLGGYFVVNSWVESNHPGVWSQLEKNYDQSWREYRIQWMDWMIDYWISKGN